MNKFGIYTGSGSGGSIANGVDKLTTSEVQQLANINTSTVSTVQWSHVGVMDQNITTTSEVLFGGIKDTTPFVDNADNTKKMHFQLSVVTAGQDRVITVLDQNLTLVGLTNVQTLTDKTLTAPVINSATIGLAAISNSSITKLSEVLNVDHTLTTAESGKMIISNNHTGITLTLPSIITTGVEFFFINEDVTPNTVRVLASGANTIDGASTTYIDMTLRYNKLHLVSSNGGVWYTF